jgi:N utilization substance protein B
MSHQRSKARKLAVQALYQWQVAGHTTAEIIAQFAEHASKKVDFAYFRELTTGVIDQHAQLDTQLQPQLSRALSGVDPVERAILRLATYELSQRLEIPYRVIINESVELAKTYGAEQGHRFVNGVLDKTASVLRPQECQARARPRRPDGQ